MAIVTYLDAADLAESDQDLLSRPINLFRGTVNSRQAARQLLEFGHWIRWECALDPRWREMAILAVGYISRAPYEWSHHVKISQDFGVTERDINALIAHIDDAEQTHLSTADIAVIDAAVQLTRSATFDDTLVAQLQCFLDDSQLVDLVTIIGHYNAVVRILGGLRIDVEGDYQPYLDRFPLPASDPR